MMRSTNGRIGLVGGSALLLAILGWTVSCRLDSTPEGKPSGSQAADSGKAALAPAPSTEGPTASIPPAPPAAPAVPAQPPMEASKTTTPPVPPTPPTPPAPVPGAAQGSPPAPAAPAPSTPPAPAVTAAQPPPPAQPVPGVPKPDSAAAEDVVFTMPQGQIVIHLFEKECPTHCENFKRLVKSGFFNGMSFHRACPGFAQAGDPTGTGKGGIEQTIPAEIKRTHLRGSVVAARRDDARNPHRESHGSQFFILKQVHSAFDGQYTVFGQVVRGMEIVDRIPQGDKEDDYHVPPGAGEKILHADLVPAGPPSGLPQSQPAAKAGMLIQPKGNP